MPPAALPPPEPPEPAPLEDSPDSLLGSPLEDSEDEVAPVAPLAAVEVVEVEVDWAAAFSAEVSVGGVMSGVLAGTVLEALPEPPQAASVRLESTMTAVASAALAIEGRGRGARAGRCGLAPSRPPRAGGRRRPITR